MDVAYSASILVAVVTGSGFRLPDPVREVYGILVPRKERCHVAAICIEANKNRTSRQDGQLVSLLLCHNSATAMMALPDVEVTAAAVEDAERFLPGLARHIAAQRIYRWNHAEPRSPVGRSRDIADYRSNRDPLDRRVWLAGDYMSMPFTEGAAESGKWAADAVWRRIANGTGKPPISITGLQGV
jgi:oxygen-dependent protoporphyrinogen oxidase